MKKKIIVKRAIVCIALVGLFASVNSISAATRSKSLDGGYAGTTIRVSNTYDDTSEYRWILGSATQIASTGKGGGSSKSGSLKTSKSNGIYRAEQKYNISSTNYNYVTVSGTRTFIWEIKDSTLTWQNCYVK